MNRFQYKLSSIAMTLLLLAAMLYVGREAAAYVAGTSVEAQDRKSTRLNSSHL